MSLLNDTPALAIEEACAACWRLISTICCTFTDTNLPRRIEDRRILPTCIDLRYPVLKGLVS